MQIGPFVGFAETMLALDLDVIEAMGQREAFDLGALDAGCAIGDQREFDAERLQRIDRVMRARKHERLILAIDRETIGDPYRKLFGKAGFAGGRERGKTVLHRDPPGFVKLQPPHRLGGGPEFPGLEQDRLGDLAGRVRRQFVGEFGSDDVPGDFGTPIGRQDGVVHVDQHRARQLRHGYGHFTSGGIDDRIESTLPPVLSPNVVPRSYSRLNSA